MFIIDTADFMAISLGCLFRRFKYSCSSDRSLTPGQNDFPQVSLRSRFLKDMNRPSLFDRLINFHLISSFNKMKQNWNESYPVKEFLSLLDRFFGLPNYGSRLRTPNSELLTLNLSFASFRSARQATHLTQVNERDGPSGNLR
jgi:hypothetical protein